MNFGLEGKRALVFGGSSGLGFAVAESFIGEKMRVAVCARPGEKLDTLGRSLPAAVRIAGDLSRPGEGRRVTEEAIRQLGGLDVVLLNTGGPPTGGFTEITAEKWAAGFQGLWMSAVDAIQAALPTFQEQKSGRVILIASSTAREPVRNLTVSNGLRAGLLGLVKSLSSEVAAQNITVNAILPGFINTERLQELGLKEEDIVREIPMGRLGQPREVASVATFLASDMASYVTGQSLMVDGGRTRGF
jgi:3-oxoacyl-[acyl-carrier protein] reductase